MNKLKIQIKEHSEELRDATPEEYKAAIIFFLHDIGGTDDYTIYISWNTSVGCHNERMTLNDAKLILKNKEVIPRIDFLRTYGS